MKKALLILTAIILIFSSCKNVKIEDDYYYEESETVDGMKITLKGKGYGLYGQLISKYKSGSIGELMAGKPMKIRTASADDNNSSYNEIYLTFEKNGYVKNFETEIEVLKVQGLSQIRVFYTDDKDKEYSLYSFSKEPFKNNIKVEKEVKAITLCIRGYKFYPTTFSSLQYKGDWKEEDFEEKKGKQVDNEFTIKSVKITE